MLADRILWRTFTANFDASLTAYSKPARVCCKTIKIRFERVYNKLVPMADLTLALTLCPNSKRKPNLYSKYPCPDANPNTNPNSN